MSNKAYATLGFLSALIFWTTYFVIANLRSDYSFLTKGISELGSVDAHKKWIWNVFGYIVPGLLISTYSIGLFKNIAERNTSKLPLVGICLSGLFLVLSGIFPGDFVSRHSTTMLLHTIGSFGSYLFLLIGAFTFPREMKKTSYWKSAIKPTLVFTMMTIVFGSWLIAFPNYPAAGQRIVFSFYFLWIAYTSYMLYIDKKSERKIILR